MLLRTCLPAALLFVPVPVAAFPGETGDEPATPSSSPPVPAQVASSPAQPRRPGPVAERAGGDGGELGASPVAYDDDSVPMPGADVAEARDEGDVLVQRAAGDPHFLGFAAGRHFPPPDERVDPDLAAQLRSRWDDGRPAQETYAFVMFAKRMTPERLARLEALGCRLLGFHPHYTTKIALAPQAIDEVASLEFVRWIGTPKSWQKVHPRLGEELSAARPGELVDVYVNVYDSDLGDRSTWRSVGMEEIADLDQVRAGTGAPAKAWMSNGWQQRALEALGLDVVEYVDAIRAFRARMAPASLEQVVALDFVQFVEADLPQQPFHDESTPLALTDYGRITYDGGFNDVAIAGEIDSGMRTSHTALNHVYGVGWNFTSDPSGAFDDGCGHGSHVAGTIFGLPDATDAGYTGNAPGLGGASTLRIRNARMFDDACNASGSSVASLFGVMEASYTDGSGDVSAKPHAINCSWGTPPSTPWIGSEADARTLDAEVLTYDQLYVFAAGNSGPGGSTIGLPACAKNAFTVASVLDYRDTEGDPGSLRSSSSRGPCGDDRWKPNIAAPGKWIRSVDASTTAGFADMSGTSMAAPHVTGLAAQLCDRYSFLRYAPHRLASVIMASAMTNADASLAGPSTDPAHHYNTFGAGRINAHKAHVGSSSWTWTNWSVTLASGSSTSADFDVPAGTTRVVVCMTYHEAASSAGASAALVNDLDLWIDNPSNGIDPNNNTGEYFAHQSPRDNTEIRYIGGTPLVGTWRWKIWPDSTSSTSTVSVTVGIVSADTTPDGSLTVTADDVYVQPNADVTITADAFNPEYYASCVFLDTTSAGDALQASTTTLEDGIVTDLMTNAHLGRDVTLGTIRPNDTRTATWVTRWASEGVKSWSVNARSDNWVDETAAVNVTVDGTAPGIATNLTSSTHAPNVWSSNPNITYTWTAATDNLSGVDGYGIFTSQSATGAPGTVKDIEEVTTYAETLATASNGYYFKMRTVDHCGNWSPSSGFAVTGPYFIDTLAPTGPGAISSTTHTPGVQSCNTTVTVQWTAPADPHSGVANQYLAVNTIPVFDPTGGAILGPGVTSNTTNIGSSASARYYHLRARDVAGNWGATQHFGPIYANANSVSTYCTGKVNSLGCTPAIGWINQPSKSAGNFTVRCTNVINNRFGLIFWGYGSLAAPFQGGFKCVADPVVRTPVHDSGGTPPGVDDCSGIWSFTFDTAYMNAYGIDPGDTLYAQAWGRDPAVPSTTSLSNAVQFTVCE